MNLVASIVVTGCVDTSGNLAGSPETSIPTNGMSFVSMELGRRHSFAGRSLAGEILDVGLTKCLSQI
jgi:hypothetical protein